MEKTIRVEIGMPGRALRRILVADDLAENRELLEKVLKRAGYGVESVEDGFEALEAFERERFDLALMDIDMPGMDGCEAAAEIRRREAGSTEGRRTVVVALTGYEEDAARTRCEEGAFDDYLSKPVRRTELLAVVGKWTGGGEPSFPEERPERGAGPEKVPMDLQRAIDEFEGDRELLLRLLSDFLSTGEERLKALRKAFFEGDIELVRRSAHTIKGGAANLRAEDLASAASNLEKNCESAISTGDARLVEKLELEFRRLGGFAGSIRSG